MTGPILAADGLPPLREVVRRYGLEPKKALGQNFLFDLNLTGRIARAAGPLAGTTIFEVGPGPGGLTRALLNEGAANVVAIERDRRCLAALAEIAAHYPDRLRVIEGDALTIDPARCAGGDRALRIVANLPYNIGTALLTRWLTQASWPPRFDRLVLMFQREVADRIVATPAERADYGRLAVLCGWRARARILFDVPAAAFVPPPKVTSAIVEIVPRPHPAPCSVEKLEALTLAAFGQRRKMLRQSLKGAPGLAALMDISAFLEETGIAGMRRAEEIDVSGFVTMAQVWERLSLRSAGGPPTPS